MKAVSGINTPLYVRVTDVPPHAPVRIAVSTVDAYQQPWSTEQVFHADADGVVDLANTLPESAQWEPAHSLGILWSMRPDSSGLGEDDANYFELNGLAPVHLNFRVRIRGEGLGSLLMRTIARNVVEFDAPCGPAFHPTTPTSGASQHPGVVLLSHAPAATDSASAAALAHHGFAVLFARTWPTVDELRQFHAHEFVDSRVPLALVAHGRACVGAFEVAEAYPEFVGPVVAHSPCSRRFPDPTRAEFRRSQLTGKPADLWGFYADQRDAAPRIEVSRLAGPLLLTSGTEDAVWDAQGMAGELAAASESRGVETFHVSYEGAGHACGYPFAFPGLPTSLNVRDHGHRIRVGGSIDANGRAAEVSRQQVISFLASFYDMPVTTL